MKWNSVVWRQALPALMLTLPLLYGCSQSEQGNERPVADAGPDISARFQSDVILSGRDSYDPDGPVMQYQWRQIAGPETVTHVLNNSTIRVVLPAMDAEADIVYELQVTDNRGKTGSDRITISAKAPGDPNRFLTFFSTPDEFMVEAVLAESNPPLSGEVSFTAVASTEITYTDLNGVTKTVTQGQQSQSASWTPESQAAELNPRLNFSFPIVDLFSLLDLNEGQRDQAQVAIRIELQDLTSSVDYVLQILDVEGEPIDNSRLLASSATASVARRPADNGSRQMANDPTPDGIEVSLEAVLNALTSEIVESRATAEAYYRAIDPDNEKTTLQDWRRANGFEGATDIVRGRYINGFDLGFGRDMQMRVTEEGYIYASVSNYPNMDSLVAGTNLIANVSMEFSPGPEGGDPFTKFYTFAPNPETGQVERVLSMDFDGRGEKFTPGNCAVCHGGRPQPLDSDGNYPDGGDIGARFLPWDVDTLAFSDAEYEGRNSQDASPFHRADQESVFKFFNMAILPANLTAAQIDLIHGWYGGDSMPSAVFDGSYVPQGWRTPANGGPDTNPDFSEALYLEVVGPTCRACHAGIETTNFATYDSFRLNHDAILRYVYDEGVMPMARITMDNFWVERFGGESRAAKLLDYLNRMDPSKATSLSERRPGLPKAVISLKNRSGEIIANSNTATLVVADAGDSLFASTYEWSMQYQPPTGESLSSAALLSNARQSQALMKPDMPGTYQLALSVTNGQGQSDASVQLQVPDIVPVALPGDMASDAEGELPLADAEALYFDVLANDVAGNLPVSIEVVSAPALGTIALDDNGTESDTSDDRLVYRPADPYASVTDSFSYRLRDVDGDTSSTALVAVVTNASVNAPSKPVISTITASKPTPRVTLNWSASAAQSGDSMQAYRVERRTGSGAFQTVAELDSAQLSYTDTSGEPDTVYEYRIRSLTTAGAYAIGDIESVTTLAQPTIPANLSAQAIAGRDRVRLTWDASSYAEGSIASYELERKLALAAADSFSAVASISHSASSAYEWVDPLLSLDTGYDYRVKAVAADATESGYTSAVRVTTSQTNSSNMSPDAPVWSLTAPSSTSQVSVAYTVPADADGKVTSLTLQRALSGSGSFSTVTSLDVSSVPAGTNGTLDDATGLPGTALDYRWQVEDDEGAVTLSAIKTAVTGNTVPDAPVISSAVVDVSGSSPEAVVSWATMTDPDDGAAVSYSVRRQPLASFSADPLPGSWTTPSVSVTVSGATTTLRDSTLGVSDYYIYEIIAEDADGGQSPAAYARVQNINSAPDAVSDLTAAPSSVAKQVALSWTQPSDDGRVVAVRIYRVRNTDCSLDAGLSADRLLTTLDTSGISAGATVNYTDSASLCSAERYQYYVVAEDNLGVESSASATASFAGGLSTFNQPPSTPTLTVTRINETSASDYQLQLAIAGSADADADDSVSYRIYRNGGLLTTVSRSGSTTSFTDTGVNEALDNSYSVVATDGHGDAVATASVSEPPLVTSASYSQTFYTTANGGVHTLSPGDIIAGAVDQKGYSGSYDAISISAVSLGADGVSACGETTPSSGNSYTYSVSDQCVGDSSYRVSLRYGSYWTPTIMVNANLRTGLSFTTLDIASIMASRCQGCHSPDANTSTAASARTWLQTHTEGTIYSGTFVTNPATREYMYSNGALNDAQKGIFNYWINHGQHCQADSYECQ